MPARAQCTVFIHMLVYKCHGTYTCECCSWKLRLKCVSNFRDNKSKKPEFAENQENAAYSVKTRRTNHLSTMYYHHMHTECFFIQRLIVRNFSASLPFAFHVNAEYTLNCRNTVFITHCIRLLIYESNEAKKDLRDPFFLNHQALFF